MLYHFDAQSSFSAFGDVSRFDLSALYTLQYGLAVAASREADLRPRHAVAGAQPSGRLMGLRLRPALLLPARRLGVGRPFSKAGLNWRDAVERSPLIV